MHGSAQVSVIILSIFLACCANVVSLEYLVKADSGIGNLVTFSSFVFISIHGCIFTSDFFRVRPKVPLTSWACLVIVYFIVSVANNYAFSFGISAPLHMIFRSGSLIANVILDKLVTGKMHSIAKYISVVLITVGISACTIASSTDSQEIESVSFFVWSAGLLLLTFALFAAAYMGLLQERISRVHGKHPREALLYTHLLPLPFFALLTPDLVKHGRQALQSSPIVLYQPLQVPSMVFWLAVNVLTQFMCVSSVFRLTTECSSLTVNLVLTLRKFISLLFSIWYFANPFTLTHWLGAMLVFVGTTSFMEMHTRMAQLVTNSGQLKVQ